MESDIEIISRRRLLKATAALALAGGSCRSAPPPPSVSTRPAAGVGVGEVVNDVHSQLNPTRVAAVVHPDSAEQLAGALRGGNGGNGAVSICGGRHAGGGQQFLTNGRLIDMSRLSRVLWVDRERGLIKAEAGIRWPALYDAIRASAPQWAFQQKQGADELSLGGAVSANIHGRCLHAMPIVGDIEALEVLDADGEIVRCSRTENFDRFRHVVGGYGMFGTIYAVTLRLIPRQKLIKHVEWIDATDAVPMLKEAADRGAVHGDFQYAVDEKADDFMRAGMVSWYEPTDADAPVFARTPEQARAEFSAIVTFAHRDKPAALAAYRKTVLASNGRVNWSDSWLMGDYLPGYHRNVEAQTGAAKGSEILSEIYVPRDCLPLFLRETGETIGEHGANLIYGSVRFTKRDDITALPWAKQDYACVVLNLHTELEPAAIERNADTFRAILDLAIARGGSYYLTYHCFARPDQVLACYPQLPAVLRAKNDRDPRGVVQSDWQRRYAALLL